MATLVLALALFACAYNPATGERQLVLMSQEQEVRLGREAAQQARETMSVYDEESALDDYVEKVGRSLAAETEKPELPWSFDVVEDPAVNAFALPGGPIFVTRGILVHMQSEAELAAVLAHEIAHVTARHAATQMAKAQMAQLGLGLGMVVAPELASFGQLAGAGLQLLFLKYSRDDERQADELGLRYLRQSPYEPTAMVDILAMLDRVSKAQDGGGGVPEWASTHPDPANRAQRIAERIPSGTLGVVERDAFLDQLEGLVFGPDPREGYFEDGHFIHPELRFELHFPSGWETRNQPDAVVGVSPQGNAAVQLTLVPADSPQAAERRFFEQSGVQAGEPWSARFGGLPSEARTFRAQTQQGVVEGLAAFVQLGGRVFQLLGFTPEGGLSQYGDVFRASLASFGRVTDPELLDVEPHRIEIVTLAKDTTLASVAAERPSPVPLDALGLLNRVDPSEILPAGRKLKWVVSGH